MENPPRLVITQGPQPGKAFTLDQASLTIGRDPSNQIVISNPQVSRRHARIQKQADLVIIEDMGSTNGTFVNGMQLSSPHTLSNGDSIGLGDAVKLTYQSAPAASGASPPAEKATLASDQRYDSPPPSPPSRHGQASSPAYSASPPPPASASSPAKSKSKQMLWIGCGCLVLLLVFACVAVFALDYLDVLPDIFYEPLSWFGLI